MDEKFYKDLLQRWFDFELSSVPEIKPTQEVYDLLHRTMKTDRSFLSRTRWLFAAAALVLLVFLSVTNFQYIFYPPPVPEKRLEQRPSVEEKEEIMFDRSFKMHKKMGVPSAEKVIFHFQREGSAFSTDVDMTQSLEHPIGLGSNDNFRISVTYNKSVYLYVFQINSENTPIKLFPDEKIEFTNPLEANRNYSLPGVDEWYYLDEQTGEEELYLYTSDVEAKEFDIIYSKYYKARSNSKREKLFKDLINKLEELNSHKLLIENQ